MGMVNCKEKNYCDSIFVNESFEETKPGTSASVITVLFGALIIAHPSY